MCRINNKGLWSDKEEVLKSDEDRGLTGGHLLLEESTVAVV